MRAAVGYADLGDTISLQDEGGVDDYPSFSETG